jgi:hypothetical protein
MLDKAKQIILNIAIKNGNCEQVEKIIASGNVDLTYEVQQEDVNAFMQHHPLSVSDVSGKIGSMIRSNEMEGLMQNYGVERIAPISQPHLPSKISAKKSYFDLNSSMSHPYHIANPTFETITTRALSIDMLEKFCLKHLDEPCESFFKHIFLASIQRGKLRFAEYIEEFLLTQFSKKITDFQDYQNKIYEALCSALSDSDIDTINYCKKFDTYVDRKLSDFISAYMKLETLKYLIEDVGIEVDANECVKRVAMTTNKIHKLEFIKFFIEKYNANNFYETFLCLIEDTSSFHYQPIKSIVSYLLQKSKVQLAKTNILPEILQKNLDKEFGISWIKFLMQNDAKCDPNDSSIAHIVAAQCSSQYYWNFTSQILYLLELGFNPNLKFNAKTPLEYALIRDVNCNSNIVKSLLIAGADISSFSEQQKEKFGSLMPEKILKYQQEIFQKYKKIILDIPAKDFELFVELVDAFDHSYKSQDSSDHHLTSIYNAIVIFNLKSSGIPKHFLDGTYDTLLQQLFQQKTGIVDEAAIHQVKIQMLALELQNPDCDKAKIADALLYLSSKKYIKDATLAKIVLKALKSGDELPIWMGVANMDMYLDIEVDVFGVTYVDSYEKQYHDALVYMVDRPPTYLVRRGEDIAQALLDIL